MIIIELKDAYFVVTKINKLIKLCNICLNTQRAVTIQFCLRIFLVALESYNTAAEYEQGFCKVIVIEKN